jgi:hypothetical protein
LALWCVLGCSPAGEAPESLGSQSSRLAGYGGSIKYPSGASADVVALAGELELLLEQITGASFSVSTIPPGDTGTSGIYLASPANWGAAVPAAVLARGPQLSSGTRGSYALSSDGSGWLWVTATSAHGLSNGVYDYLNRLGYRALLPGANWEIVPARSLTQVQLAVDELVEPAMHTYRFAGQGGFLANIWQREHNIGHDLPTLHEDAVRWSRWMKRNRFPSHAVTPGHMYSKLHTARQATLRADKLALPEIAGTRQFLPTPLPTETSLKIHYTGHGTFVNDNGGGAYTLAYSDGTNQYYEDPDDYSSQAGVLGELGSYAVSQLAFYANQDVPNATSTSVEPSDGGGHCDCQKCLALLRNGPYVGMPTTDSTVSDRVFHAANMAAKAVSNAFPGANKRVGVLAYNDHAPVPHVPLEQNVSVWVTPNGYHFPYTGLSPDALLDAWGDKSLNNPAGPFDLGIYDYISMPSDTLGSVRQNALMLEGKMKRWHGAGYRGVSLESSFGAGPAGPTALVGAALAWDPQRDAASILDNFVHDAFSAGAFQYVRPIYAQLYEASFALNYVGLSKLLRALTEARAYLATSGSSAELARLTDIESYAHYLRLLYDYENEAKNSQAGCTALDAVFKWMWSIDSNMMLPTRRIHELLYARGECTAATMTPNLSRWNWASNPNAAGFVEVASANPWPTMAATIAADLASFPELQYREVSYARDLSDYFVLPTPTPLTAPPAVTISLKRPNHFIFHVPVTQSVSLSFSVGNPAYASNPPVDLSVFDGSGALLHSESLPSQYQTSVQTTVTLGTLQAGNYEFDLIPRGNSLSYAVLMSPGIPIAFKNGAHLAVNNSAYYLYFYVPAEVDTAFIAGSFNGSYTPVFYPPGGGAITPTAIDSKLYSLDTHGKPGVWAVKFVSLTNPVHFINLPDVFSLDRNAVITSKRIRTAMVSATAGAASPVTSPNLKYNNRFAFQLATPGSPTFTIGTGTSVGSPSPITVELLDQAGDDLPGSPFSLVPGGSYSISAGQLAAGSYELAIKNPSLYNAYSITVPAGLPFVSVDGYGLGNVWLPSYRAYFTVPAGTSSVRFAAAPTGVPIEVYNGSGALVPGQPVALGNNVFEIQGTTAGTWALNLKGEYWSDIRMLNVPQIMSFSAPLHMTVAP